jgi:chemotaxis protein MotB
MAGFRRRSSEPQDIWPGFVDALASLIMIIIFLLTFFMVSHFILGESLSGQDNELSALKDKIQTLNDVLNLEQTTSADLTHQIDSLTKSLNVSQSDKDALNQKLKDYLIELNQTKAHIKSEESKSRNKAAEIALLSAQIGELNKELQKLANLIGEKEQALGEKDKKIEELGEELNRALVKKLKQLETYRSEFFGKLKEILKNQKDVDIKGDRFVLQSEVLFDTASATLNEGGTGELKKLAATLKTIIPKIPKKIPWVLRVDGHTDNRPMTSTVRFASNWELSSARAISVVNFLIKQGIPAQHLAATGFGEFHPIDPKKDEIAYRRNRRIEFKLTD